MINRKYFKESSGHIDMIWPGTSDPYKRRKTLKFLLITALIGGAVAAASTAVQSELNKDNPLRELCVNNRDTPYKIKATLELIVDNEKAEIPATSFSSTYPGTSSVLAIRVGGLVLFDNQPATF